MAFQNNSGDIILDVVLTDEGRRRLALGNGSFGITQFALGDDEINYALFEAGSTTALQDLSILQTPILEAFTNNTSMMKSKLLSLPNPELLYLPILRLNSLDQKLTAQNNYVVCVDKQTWDNGSTGNTKAIGVNTNGPIDGMIYGLDTNGDGAHIVVDSGINSTAVNQIDRTLIETSFMIEMDNRLGQIVSVDGKSLPGAAKVDDDNIATYILNLNSVAGGNKFVTNVNQIDFGDSDTPIEGPIGARLEFKIRSSQDLRVSNFLFDRIGSVDTTTYAAQHNNVKIIDSIVRVSGMTTGYSLDIPVRFAKSV
tara:strand:+ start:564 stop:1496 length:933 start_codon:yes stop_codon:yes gene_type:complete